jgi:outer membrane protein assembly factor BamB
VLDLFLDGANITARVEEAQVACVVRDLASAVLELSKEGTGKRIVHFYDEAYELCIERTGLWALVSLYRGGARPAVVVYDRPVPFEDVLLGVRDALDALPRPLNIDSDVFSLQTKLSETVLGSHDVLLEEAVSVNVDTDSDAIVSFGADFTMRTRKSEAFATACEFADLHALLFRGGMKLEVRGRAVELGDDHPFLVAEQLSRGVTELLDSWEAGKERTVTLMGPESTAKTRMLPFLRGKMSLNGEVALLVGRGDDFRASYTFPNVGLFEIGEAVLAFGRAIVRALLRRDRSQTKNLRITAFKRVLRDLGDALREAGRSDSKVCDSPESYRGYLESVPPSSNTTREMRLRYAPRWRALVPGIDLRSTFVTGQKLIVGSRDEMYCLSKKTGEVEWQVPVARAVSVATPAGLARMAPDGTLCVHDLANGLVALRTWVAPRRGGPMAGAVVHTPGLPRLLIVTEGEKHLVAIDLMSGETRWRMNWGGGGTLRMRRAGRLLLIAGGQNSLSAIDVVSGDVVWRVRDRFRFRQAPLIDGEECFVIAGGAGNPSALYRISALSGEVKFRTALAVSERHIEGELMRSGNSVVVLGRDRKGAKFMGYDRTSGAPVWTSICPDVFSGSACIAVDDRIIANTPTGQLIGLDGHTGHVVYKRALGRVTETDTPKRLEPVLRSGALFVPHPDVHVIRPDDGAVLARVEGAEAIPDLLRVDESCDIFMAEESGHLVAFGTTARLSLVR